MLEAMNVYCATNYFRKLDSNRLLQNLMNHAIGHKKAKTYFKL